MESALHQAIFALPMWKNSLGIRVGITHTEYHSKLSYYHKFCFSLGHKQQAAAESAYCGCTDTRLQSICLHGLWSVSWGV